ncbi:hypothetical protein F0344_06490 [Streptomyces finlayi]|uniref:Uncharacterized protein n=1 Tax=Streptomyces finlayi TaxID=67296 RepID=A0A7G7BG38_9ACTN|nr:hypothetical protein F0344_06490 [Streptomyces finlayi]
MTEPQVPVRATAFRARPAAEFPVPGCRGCGAYGAWAPGSVERPAALCGRTRHPPRESVPECQPTRIGRPRRPDLLETRP